MRSPFLQSRDPIPGAFSMSHFHDWFGGRFGKIHEEPLSPFSCSLPLLSGLCSALPWGHRGLRPA